jgi:flagellar protein FlaG
MIDTTNILASKPIPIVQEVTPAANSEKVSNEIKQQQPQTSSGQSQSDKTKGKDAQLSAKELEQLSKQLNEELNVFNTRVAFSIDDKTKKTVVKIIDSSNNEVIRQVPPDYLLKISQNISELLGLLVDEKA